MMPIYILLLFIGVLMTFFQLIYLTAGKHSLSKSMKLLADKQNELENVLKDADIMVDELNNISDYIVQIVDVKTSEVERVMELSDERAKYLQSIEQMNKIVAENKKNIGNSSHSNAQIISNKNKPVTNRNDKIIAFGTKHAQVLSMSDDGLNDAEIARNLNIGKGEIELIRGMNKVSGSQRGIPFN